jgi:membrane protease YdiL (CAAX protease family)
MKPDPQTLTRNFWQILFISPDEPRLRAGWRLALHTLLVLSLGIAAGFVVLIPLGLLGAAPDSLIYLLGSQAINLVAITGATLLARRYLDRRSIASLGLKLDKSALRDLLAGIAIPFFQMGLIFSIEVYFEWTKIEGFAWQFETGAAVAGGLGIWLLIFLAVGWQEELFSRGYHLQTLESGLNTFWAVLISSSIFGLLHLGNPGASWISTLGILLAGLFLALPYLLTRQLWLSIGLHIGWNFFEGVVFGFPVSGLETFRLLRHTVSGPELWTGGGFGPEAGLLVLPALLLGAVLVYGYVRSPLRASAG